MKLYIIIINLSCQSSGAVWKSRWPSWAPVPNKPTVSADVKQHFNNNNNLSCLLQTYCCLSTNWQFLETYGVTTYGNIEPRSRIGLSLSLICQPTSEDIKQHRKKKWRYSPGLLHEAVSRPSRQSPHTTLSSQRARLSFNSHPAATARRSRGGGPGLARSC